MTALVIIVCYLLILVGTGALLQSYEEKYGWSAVIILAILWPVTLLGLGIIVGIRLLGDLVGPTR